jgi:Smr domain
VFKIGDYVRFLNEKQEGVVTRLIDHQLIGVSIDGDFEITVLANEVVLVQAAESQLREEFEEMGTSVAQLNKTQEDKLYLAIHRDEKIQHLYHMYLINATSYHLLTAASIQKKDLYEGIYADVIKSGTAARISTHTISEFDQGWIFQFQLIYHLMGEHKPSMPKIYKKTIKAKQVISTEKEIPYLQKKGYVSELALDHTIQFDKEEMLEKLFSGSAESQQIQAPSREVDLHIEELTDKFPSMQAEEMLRFQLEAFRKNLEAAIAHQYQSIIFIHGVGNGTLRNEIHKQLGKHPHVKTFKDARKEKFGYGATEIILK